MKRKAFLAWLLGAVVNVQVTPTHEAVQAILQHQRKEQIVIGICVVAVVAFLAMKTLRRER